MEHTESWMFSEVTMAGLLAFVGLQTESILLLVAKMTW